MAVIEYNHPYEEGKSVAKVEFQPLNGVYRDLDEFPNDRKISKEVCEKWNVKVIDYLGKQSIAFPYYINGELAGNHIKPPDKKCIMQGPIAECDLFGSHVYSSANKEGKTLVITEGHLDCLSVSIAIASFPKIEVTSLDNGTGGVENMIKYRYKELDKYDSIVLAFDNDDAGKAATEKFIKLYNKIGKIKRIKYPGNYKDANECHQKGLLEKLKWAIYDAEVYKPKTIVDWKELKEKVVIKPTPGISFPWKSMTDITHGYYGRQEGKPKVYVITGPTGAGKTSFMKEITSHLTTVHGRKGGLFYLEQTPVEVVHKLLGSKFNQDLEQPDTQWWDEDAILKECEELEKSLFMFDPSQGINLNEVIESIYYFVNVSGVDFVVIDNLTILSQNMKVDGKRVDENTFAAEVARQLNKLKTELGVTIFLICHLSNDKITKQAYVSTSPKNIEKYGEQTADDVNRLVNKAGLTWEQGRRPTMENIRYAGVINMLADWVFGLSRNSKSEDDFEFRTLIVECLKTRNAKRNAKKEFKTIWDINSGRLVEYV